MHAYVQRYGTSSLLFSNVGTYATRVLYNVYAYASNCAENWQFKQELKLFGAFPRPTLQSVSATDGFQVKNEQSNK